ncbi:MAG: lipoate--protein ligase [Prolixibacteraceae bacterium]|nr:lipoate--protein ligase [Prolixibacteraceae bacterium]
MLSILSTLNDPAFNLAAEEYLFRNSDDDLLFLYINSPSVVIGKHQNALAEIDPWYIYENKIPVIRRLSGGGAVYHDPGNLNFSFHKTVADPAKISFSVFTIPVVKALKQMGIPAEITKRNDIFVNGLKVSGHAEHVFRKRVLSHGTLLLNANREKLSKALHVAPGLYSGKAIKSVRSNIANISDFLKKPISMNEFIASIKTHFDETGGEGFKSFTKNEIATIEKLANEKYRTWEWNFGYSPAYVFQNEGRLNDEINFSCTLHVENGIIGKALFEGEKLPSGLKTIEKALSGNRHEIETFKNLIAINKGKTISTNDEKTLLQGLF